jgi:magnesium chelatase family protein
VDRVDIFIEVPKVKTEKLQVTEDYSGREDSQTIKNRVETARAIQNKRFTEYGITANSEM